MSKKKLCIDAGHDGKYNRSPAVKSYYESDMNWKLHLLLKKYLEQYGFEVILTRSTQETDLEVTKRGKLSKGCDLLLSIHSNAVGNYTVNESVDYPVVYVPLNGTGDKIGKLLADCIADVMETKQKGRIATRKGNNGDYYGVIRGAVAVGTPGLILEHSFHTNTRSTNWLLNDSNLDKLAKAEAKVIAEYYGERTTVSDKAPETTQTIKSLSGFVKVIYKGSDGLNVRTSPGMGDNIREVVHGGTYTVVGISADGKWYKLKSGGFISTHEKYVKFTADEYYAKYTGKSSSVDVAFKEIGVPGKFRGSWGKRKPVATANGIENYIGSAAQNTKLVNLAKQGKLKRVL